MKNLQRRRKRMRAKLCTLLAIFTLTLASSITAFAAPEVMPDGSMFDAEYYAQNNPDVVAAFGTDKELLYSHYVNCGKAEGRLAVADVNTLVPSPAYLPSMSLEAVLAVTYEDYLNMSNLERVRYLDSAGIYGVGEKTFLDSGRTYGTVYQEGLAQLAKNEITGRHRYRGNIFDGYDYTTFESFFACGIRNYIGLIGCSSYEEMKEIMNLAAKNKTTYLSITTGDNLTIDQIKQVMEEAKVTLKQNYGAEIKKYAINGRITLNGYEPRPGHMIGMTLNYE